MHHLKEKIILSHNNCKNCQCHSTRVTDVNKRQHKKTQLTFKQNQLLNSDTDKLTSFLNKHEQNACKKLHNRHVSGRMLRTFYRQWPYNLLQQQQPTVNKPPPLKHWFEA